MAAMVAYMEAAEAALVQCLMVQLEAKVVTEVKAFVEFTFNKDKT
jgi:hypothetical protein